MKLSWSRPRPWRRLLVGPRGGASPEPRARSPVPVDDTRLLAGVRHRLVAFSAVSMLVVLLALGVALYAAVAQQLSSTGMNSLEARADDIAEAIERGVSPVFGLQIGGRSSGTLAIAITPRGEAFGNLQGVTFSRAVLAALPYEPGVKTALAGHDTVQETVIDGTPFRILTRQVPGPDGTYTVQIVQDRVAEQRTLDVLLVVLAAGGLLAVALAAVVGFRYAGQALVPIRESLRRQREFAADASHELRTPLAVLRGGLEHLRRHPEQSLASQSETLDDLQAEVGHLSGLVDDLLLLARADSGALDLARQPADLAEVAVEAMGPLTHLARSREAELTLDPEPAPIEGDATRLRQVVTILVDNALRHGRPGGHVQVAVRREERQAVLRVEDDGPGIPPADLAHVFDRFWRAAGDAGEGTGLGLAIAFSIVTAQGGSIAAENRQQGGARFTVRLPLRHA